MQSALKVLAKPFVVAIVSFLLAAIPFADTRELGPSEYLTTLTPVVLILFTLPIVILSLITKFKMKDPKKNIRLFGMWTSSFIATLIYVFSIISSTNGQAGLGLIFIGGVILGGGMIGYLMYWLAFGNRT